MHITIVKPHFDLFPGTLEALSETPKLLELAGRTCYKSEDRITDESACKFVEKICRNRHESVLEHANYTVRFVLSRSASHQLVRHRIASYSQESQRYCNYGKRGLQVICPPSIGLAEGEFDFDRTLPYEFTFEQFRWMQAIDCCYSVYMEQLDKGMLPEDARYVLPNATKTEVVVTMNARTWRHVFKERALNKHAQWEIREVMQGWYDVCKEACPSVFGDL